MLDGHHICDKAYGMVKAKMCAYPQSDHTLPHCKFVLPCFAKCTCINITDQEIDYQYSHIIPSIHFHIYHFTLCCTAHRRLPLNEKFFFACVNMILFQKNPQEYTLE